jgi:hypothetical protein
VALPVADARHHLHVLGVTGSGKSTHIANLALADIAAHRAVIVCEPKGDLVRDIDLRIGGADRDRLVLIDPTASTPPPVINLLDPRYPAGVDNLVGIFAKLYREFWGPRTDDILRVACLTLRAHHQHLCGRAEHPAQLVAPHLGDVLTLLADPAQRHHITQALTGQDAGIEAGYLRTFWDTYEQLSPAARATHTAPLGNKLRALLLRPFARAVLTGTPTGHPGQRGHEPGGSGGRALDMTRILDRGGILLARLPEGVLTPDTTRLLGSLLVAHTWHALTARARRLERDRPDVALYLDEAHCFLHMPTPIEDLLAQARGYRMSCLLAHQNLAQLTPELRAAVSGNALTKIYFRTSPEDATSLEKHVTPHLGAHDLAHLDRYTAAARLHINNASTPAFTLTTRPLPTVNRTPTNPADLADLDGAEPERAGR